MKSGKMGTYIVGPDKYSYNPNYAIRSSDTYDAERSIRGSPEPLVINTSPPPEPKSSGKNIALLFCGGICCLIIFCITAVFFAFFVFNSGPFGPGVYKTARVVEGFSIG